MACLTAVGIKPGDEVLVPGYTFVASFSSIIAIGAVPVMVEIDESLTMDAADARTKITPKTRAIMPVHMLGNPSDMDAITSLGEGKGIVPDRGLLPGSGRFLQRERCWAPLVRWELSR